MAAEHGLGQPIDAADRWRAAGKVVTDGHAVLSNFRTLRDVQGGSYIPPDQLRSIQKLGAGTFASVDKAWYSPTPDSRVMVAVKRLRPEMTSHPEDLRLFSEEAALMRKLKHKNVVELVGVGQLEEADDKPQEAYMVQEYMAGGTLHQMVVKEMMTSGGRRHVYSLADALDMCLQIAEGLAYLHNSQPLVIHRDLKLENILLKYPERVEGRFVVKLADFGLSKKVDTRMARLHLRRENSGVLNPDSNELEKLERGWSLALDQSSLPDITSAASAPATKPSQPPKPDTGGSPVRLLSIKSAGSSAAASSGSGLSPLARVGSTGSTGSSSRLKSKSRSKVQDGEPGVLPRFTGQTGSLMYMAPEVFKEEVYNEKADVFSYAMIMYQLVQRYLTILAISNRGSSEEIMAYAARVSDGYRPPINSKLPPCVVQLIQDCWAHDPAARPCMAEVVERLRACLEEVKAADAAAPKPGCECAIS